MLMTACHATGSVVLSNSYDRHAPLLHGSENGSVEASCAHAAPVVLFPVASARNGYRNYRLRPDAYSFVADADSVAPDRCPQVTTIIRYHGSGDPSLLEKALYSLAAMQDCVVRPLIAVQDLDSDQLDQLRQLLGRLPWAEGREARILTFDSPAGAGDLRARMLTEAVQSVASGYAGFLDYDDLLLPHAYAWLIARLRKTGKAVAFGRVYSTSYERGTGRFIERRREFTHGFCYDDFFACNHAPLHSFLLDLDQLDTGSLSCHDDQRYLEDYYLTLQLFTRDNTDWASLAENMYIGDYMHPVDGVGTLATADRSRHESILTTPEYRLCQQRIEQLRDSLAQEQEGRISSAG
jgi:hypothetical protein